MQSINSSLFKPCVLKINLYALLTYMYIKTSFLTYSKNIIKKDKMSNEITIGKQMHSKICLNVIFFEKYNLVQVSRNTSTKTIKM